MANQIDSEISERKDAETLFKSVIELTPNGLIMVNSTRQIVLSNTKIESMFGYSLADLKDQELEILLPLENRLQHKHYASDLIAKGKSRAMEGRDLYGRRKDGSIFSVEVGLVPISVKGLSYFLAAVYDITQRKENEKLLKEQNDQLKQANSDLESFAYVASHDLNAPLFKIRQASTILIDDYSSTLPEEAKKMLNMLTRGCVQMTNLISELLNYSKTGRNRDPFKEIDLNTIVEQSVSNLEAVIEEANAHVTIDSLPTIFGDETAMLQLFQNLIGNGIKYNQNSTPTIEINSFDKGEQWQIECQDNGIGIPAEYHKKIFKAFERLHGYGTYQGTGIGLATCKKAVELHGGSLVVESEPDKGSKFVILIPKTLAL